jgi:hypothetical protein
LRFCQVLHGWSPVFDAPWELTIQLRGLPRTLCTDGDV